MKLSRLQLLLFCFCKRSLCYSSIWLYQCLSSESAPTWAVNLSLPEVLRSLHEEGDEKVPWCLVKEGRLPLQLALLFMWAVTLAASTFYCKPASVDFCMCKTIKEIEAIALRFADKHVKMRRNKEVISENLKLRQVAGVVSVLSFFLHNSRSDWAKQKEVEWKHFLENGLGGVVLGRKTKQCLPTQDFRRGFLQTEVVFWGLHGICKGTGGSGESIMFSKLLWETRQGMYFSASWIVLEMWRRQRALGQEWFLRTWYWGMSKTPLHAGGSPRSPNHEA